VRVAGASRRPLRVLFVCTENAGRSQIAEALLRAKGGALFQVASAGSHPGSRVNPLVTDALRDHGIDWTAGTPKGFDTVVDQTWDLIITLCDRAREQCPAFPGKPVYAHWGMPDPAKVAGSDAEKRQAFHDAALYLKQRIDYLLLIPIDKLEQAALEQRADPTRQD
jgi:arsenate reductase